MARDPDAADLVDLFGELRVYRPLSLTVIASRIPSTRGRGTSRGYLSEVFSGKRVPSPDMAEAIAAVLSDDPAVAARARRHAEAAQRGKTPRAHEQTVNQAVFAVPSLTRREVTRPAIMRDLVDAITRRPAGVVGLHGSGGMGKTTLARMIAHEPGLRSRFPDGIVWVTLAEDVSGAQLADRVNDVVALLDGRRPPVVDPALAGAGLGLTLADRTMLLVVDDVWSDRQLEPFLQGGPQVTRLVTSRNRRTLPSGADKIAVDVMTADEGRDLLGAGLDTLPPRLVSAALTASGRWPLLISLINGAVRADAESGRPAREALDEAVEALVSAGPMVLDQASGGRHEAVEASFRAGLDRLTPDERDRYVELVAFEENVGIPRSVLERYWAHSAGWTPMRTHRFCQRLVDHSLANSYQYSDTDSTLTLHPLVRRLLRAEAGDRATALHAALVDAHRPLVPFNGTTNAWWELPSTERYLWAWLATHLHKASRDGELTECLHHPGYLAGRLEEGGPAALLTDLTLADDAVTSALRHVVVQNSHLLGPHTPRGSVAATLLSRLPHTDVLQDLGRRLHEWLPWPRLMPVAPLVDMPHPDLLRVLPGHQPFGDHQHLVVAGDGSWLAEVAKEAVQIWDTANWSLVRRVVHDGGASVLTAAPDGSWLVLGGYDGRILVIDPMTGDKLAVLSGHQGAVESVALTADGTVLASGGRDGTVRIWHRPSGQLLRVFTGHQGLVRTLVLAPDGSWLASAGVLDHVLRLWRLDDHADRSSQVQVPHRGRVITAVTDPAGARVYSGDNTGSVLVLDPRTGQRERRLTGLTTWVTSLAVAPDSTWLGAADGAGKVQIWSLPSGRRQHTLDVWTSCLAAAPDGNWLATGGTDRVGVAVWDIHTGTRRQTLDGHAASGHTLMVNQAAVSALAVAPDGGWLASAGTDDHTVRVWRVHATPKEEESVGLDMSNWPGRPDWVLALAGPATPSWFAFSGQSEHIAVLKPLSGSFRAGVAHQHWVRTLACPPSGTWIASAGDDGWIRIWDPESGTLRHKLTGHEMPQAIVNAMIAANDASWLATCADDATVRIWDPDTGAERFVLRGHTKDHELMPGIRALAAAPDGSWLASGGYDHTVRLWNPVTGTAGAVLRGHTKAIIALAASQDATLLASGDEAGSVRVWNPRTGAHHHTLSDHHDRIHSLLFGPDNTWLATTAHDDGDIQMWDPLSGKKRLTLTGHEGTVWATALAPDGRSACVSRTRRHRAGVGPTHGHPDNDHSRRREADVLHGPGMDRRSRPARPIRPSPAGEPTCRRRRLLGSLDRRAQHGISWWAGVSCSARTPRSCRACRRSWAGSPT